MLKLFLTLLGRRVCPQCAGSGGYYSESMARDRDCNTPLICPSCQGKGHIKKFHYWKKM